MRKFKIFNRFFSSYQDLRQSGEQDQKFSHDEDEYTIRLKWFSGSATGSHRNINQIKLGNH